MAAGAWLAAAAACGEGLPGPRGGGRMANVISKVREIERRDKAEERRRRRAERRQAKRNSCGVDDGCRRRGCGRLPGPGRAATGLLRGRPRVLKRNATIKEFAGSTRARAAAEARLAATLASNAKIAAANKPKPADARPQPQPRIGDGRFASAVKTR